MMQPLVRSWIVGAAVIFTGAALAPALRSEAQETPAPSTDAATPADPAGPTPEQRQIRELLQRLEKVETELGRLKAGRGQLPVEKKEQKLLTLLETPHLGSYYSGAANSRYFAARLIFINLTPQPVTVKSDQIKLDADGAELVLKEIPQQMQYASFQVGNESFSLRNLKTPAETKIAPGGTGSLWVVFSELPAGGQVPKMVIHLAAAEQKIDIDVNQYALGVMGMEVERIGPRQSLGLVTITGTLNTINAGSLADVLDNLALQKVARVVIRWGESAAPIDGQMLSWLAQAAQMAGRGEVQNASFPSIPATIRELHLARVPNQGAESYGAQSGVPVRLHKTDAEAVAAALASAYDVLPLDELAVEIERGHSLTRAAALAGGGGRLAADKLPLILKHADGDNPAMQRAALVALRHFGEPEAIAKLEQFALKNAEPLATTAVDSLAASRFPAAHEALLKILKTEAAPARKKIVGVLAKHPRPIWSDTIYEFVSDPNSGLGIDGLRALALVGHPKLLEVFEKSLSERDVAIRNEAFNILSTRLDPESEELAMKFTIEHIRNAAPTPQMTNLLNRTKDPRALPLLLALFEKQPNNRTALIGTLAAIGDQSVAQVFVKEYPRLRTNEQAAVLSALMQLKSTEFRKLAAQALLSSDFSLVNTASNGLQADGSPEAVRILIEAFEKSNNQNTWQQVANALSQAATPEARETLLKARASGDQNKRNVAASAVRNLWTRSPGYQYIYQAQNFSRQEQWKDAIQQFKLAIEIDPELPDAYAGRANAYLKQNMNKEAKADYAKAHELDPWNSQAITGLGILMVMEGDRDGGIKKLEDSRSKFPNDLLFAYNAACLYSQAYESVRKDEKAADREQKQEEYRKKALEELKNSVQLGFSDFDWMNKDPDLAPLHELEEFKEIAKPDPNQKPRAGGRRVRIPKL